MSPLLSESAPLERYGHNLTSLAKRGTFPPLASDEAMVPRVLQVLQRRRKNSPLILASDGPRRWDIVAEVIRRMAAGDAPEPLLTRQVIGLDYEALFSNLSDDTLIRKARIKQKYAPLGEKLAQAEPDSEEEWALLAESFRWPSLEEWIAPTMVLERLQSMFIAMHLAAGSFILYIDYFHRLLGGEPDRYPIDAAALLKPALNRDRIQLIGACTLEQYRQHIERDAAIQRPCQQMCVSDIGLPSDFPLD
jgi:ATP-dependent Clp protease ATP-binding subunit ClpB